LANVIGYGYFLTVILNQNEKKLSLLYLNGTILIAFTSVLINFFYPLNIYITNTFYLIFTVIGIYKINQTLLYKHNLKLIIFILILVPIINFRSYAYSDYEIYHLPYIEILKNFKIIFGLSNFSWQFGHSSIFQNIAALQFNSLMKLDSYIYFTSILVYILLAEVLFNYLKKEKLIIKFISFIFITVFIINAKRYGSLGNDLPAHALSFFTYILFFSLIYNNSNKNDSYYFILTILISIFGKLTLILNIFLVIPILLFKRNIFDFNFRVIIFIILISSSFLIKNFINTSCLFYPVNITCFESRWSSEDYDFSDPKIISLGAKAYAYSQVLDSPIIFSDFKKIIKIEDNIYSKLNNAQKKIYERYLVHKEYTKSKHWIKDYYSNHFKRKIVNELLLFSLLIFLLFYLFNKNYKFKVLNNIDKSQFFIFELFFGLVILISTIVWFANAPLLRYGISYLYILTSIPFLLFIKYFSRNKFKINSFFYIFIIIAFIYSISNNIVRIYKFDLQNDYTNNIVPLKKVSYKKTNIDKIDINIPLKPYELYCSFSNNLCISKANNEFLESKFKFKKIYNYILVAK
tara:strand:- start:791 stop:2518 length:1728 start_codon:yes stop_codon:yes gene_type:complete